MPAADTDAIESKDDELRVYQLRRFVSLGFTLDEARVLVAAGADWHRAERMLLAGCEPARVVKILT